jgi:hypothetical protein
MRVLCLGGPVDGTYQTLPDFIYPDMPSCWQIADPDDIKSILEMTSVCLINKPIKIYTYRIYAYPINNDYGCSEKIVLIEENEKIPHNDITAYLKSKGHRP